MSKRVLKIQSATLGICNNGQATVFNVKNGLYHQAVNVISKGQRISLFTRVAAAVLPFCIIEYFRSGRSTSASGDMTSCAVCRSRAASSHGAEIFGASVVICHHK